MNKEPDDHYRTRAKSLFDLGFASYDDYLRSGLWQSVKVKVFFAKGKTCVGCYKNAVTVHHRNYSMETMVGLSLKMLEPICAKCHNKIERNPDGSKDFCGVSIDARLQKLMRHKQATKPYFKEDRKPKKRKASLEVKRHREIRAQYAKDYASRKDLLRFMAKVIDESKQSSC